MVWRGSERVGVSGRERTIIDMMRNPEIGGGVRHVADIIREYARDPKHNFKKLIDGAKEAGSGAVWKRLGYLAEQLFPEERQLIREATQRRSAGNVRLDPGIKGRGKLIRRWNLWVNVQVSAEKTEA
jgi:predicted transcriptional regulator of viral defense system